MRYSCHVFFLDISKINLDMHTCDQKGNTVTYWGPVYVVMAVFELWILALQTCMTHEYTTKILSWYTAYSLAVIVMESPLLRKPFPRFTLLITHYSDVIMGAIVSQMTGVAIVYSAVCSGVNKKNIKAAFVRGTHRWPVNSPHIKLVTRKMFPFDDVIMSLKFSWRQMIIWNYNSFTVGRCWCWFQ